MAILHIEIYTLSRSRIVCKFLDFVLTCTSGALSAESSQVTNCALHGSILHKRPFVLRFVSRFALRFDLNKRTKIQTLFVHCANTNHIIRDILYNEPGVQRTR